MRQIWILFGNTGEYSDHTEWVVRAYTDKEAAHADCERLNAIAKGGGKEYIDHTERKSIIERLRQHDADADVDYTGTDYFVAECPLVDDPQIVPRPEIPHAHGGPY